MATNRDDSAVARRPAEGEMGTLMRTYDWQRTPLGPPDGWPQSLRTIANIFLSSRYAMWVGWGEDLTFFYNDAYRPTLGLQHPWALGRPAREVWSEIWTEIGPRIQLVLASGVATYDEGLLLFLGRSGFPEETYHTFSYSPLADDNDVVCGMLCVVTEETDRVIGERRMMTLRDLAARLASSNTEIEVCAAVEHELVKNSKDLPFTLVYLFSNSGDARLACSTNIPQGNPAAPSELREVADQPWPFVEILNDPATRIMDLGERWNAGTLPTGGWDRPPRQAALIPIKQQRHERPVGVLIVGINPYRPFDDAYSGFLDLISGQLAAGLANARSYEDERRRADALTELDRAKTSFFSNVSHEFRTPLTLILGPVEDLQARDTEEGESRELLRVVHRSGLRLQRLVNTLLDFSRIEAGRAQANQELEEFAYVASHDLQEPLRMVSIYSQLLLESIPDLGEEAQTYAGFVREGVTRMEMLIKDLLTYSRIVHPEQDDPKSTDLNESLQEALETLKIRIEESGAVVKSDKLPCVIGEPFQLALVFQNLLSNAIKYSGAGARPLI
jgi:signal transduction histidine kinase